MRLGSVPYPNDFQVRLGFSMAVTNEQDSCVVRCQPNDPMVST